MAGFKRVVVCKVTFGLSDIFPCALLSANTLLSVPEGLEPGVVKNTVLGCPRVNFSASYKKSQVAVIA